MHKRTSKKGFLLFVAVLLATGALVLGLSIITRINPSKMPNPIQEQITQAQQAQVQQTKAVTAMSANIPEEEKNMIPAIVAFLLLAAIPVGYVRFIVVKYAKNPDKVYAEGRKYSPRSEITFKALAADTRSFKN